MYKSSRPTRTPDNAARQSRSIYIGLLATFLMTIGGPPAEASIADREVCDHAAGIASRTHGVPLTVMRAITRTETGRTKGGKLRPWPWTVNMEGEGAWFDSEHAAKLYVSRHFDRGARSFDVGCFQINYRWHGQAFSSIDEMFDPIKNADYAAQFLRKLHREFGSWDTAAGAFHSRTPKFANSYIARFQTIRAQLDGTPSPTSQPDMLAAEVSDNTYPLPRSQAQPSRLGSLVPLGRGKTAFLPHIGG